MNITHQTTPVEQVEADALVVLGFEKEAPRSELFQRIDALTGGWPSEAYASGEFSGKPLDTALLHRPAGLKAKRLLLVGLGKPPGDVRRAAGAAIRCLKPKGVRSVAFAGGTDEVAAAIEGAVAGAYEADRYKTDKKDAQAIDSLVVIAPGDAADAARRAEIIAAAQAFARNLASEPANRLTPLILADRARETAAEAGLEYELLDQDRLRQLGMGALLGVAQGSAEPPALIILRYRPASPRGDAHLGFVGKGVTFDTGGISIKPSEGMEKMKYDMSGGAAVIGAMRALAALKPALPVTALVPAVENMPGSRAQRPGDIVTTLSGKTVEVLNTDAEGRLILADALTYSRRLGCTHLVNVATLTGAIVVALGHVNAGVFGNDEALIGRVLAAARAAGEKMWRMPLDDDYLEQLKTPFADLPNIGTRWGGAITAAAFLKEFVEGTPWVHLDIAGTAWLDDAKPYMAKGPTGVSVRTLIELATSWAASRADSY